MTCKKFWYMKNQLARVASTNVPRCCNPQVKGKKAQQVEEGVEVPEELLVRVVGHNGKGLRHLEGKFHCKTAVFRKDRPMPLVHVVAWKQHDLTCALQAIRRMVATEPLVRINYTMHYPHIGFYEYERNYPNTKFAYNEQMETVTLSGPRKQVLDAVAELRMNWAAPPTVTERLAGPKGLLIGSFGANIGTVRESFNVEVCVKGNEAIITGVAPAVQNAMRWYNDLFQQYSVPFEGMRALREDTPDYCERC